MQCEQVRRLLADLTLEAWRARRQPALVLHVQRCAPCRQLWEEWQRHEAQLGALLAVEPAPAPLWERVMADVGTAADQEAAADPCQGVVLEVGPQGLRRLLLPGPETAPTAGDHVVHPGASPALLTRALQQLREYFQGQRVIFQLPVDLSPCTAFERAVLEATATIPYGEVRSYKGLAELMGQPRAARAVGNALRRNPVPIVIPCHRVVQHDGRPGGYAFGAAWKARLLTLEQRTSPVVGCRTTRILCRRGCHHERRVREHNRIHFAHLREALASGYRPCKVCRPA